MLVPMETYKEESGRKTNKLECISTHLRKTETNITELLMKKAKKYQW